MIAYLWFGVPALCLLLGAVGVALQVRRDAWRVRIGLDPFALWKD